jgi:predicted Zn finger-like uncharacterized protein
MFTICPKCALTLAVTTADLRVAQGYVRCGRCSSVFNALARLTEERQGASPESASPPVTSPAASPSPSPSLESVTPEPDAQPVASAPPSQTAASPAVTAGAAPDEETAAAADMDVIPEEALEFNPSTTDAESVFVQPRPDPQWEAATGSFKAMVAANQDPVLELEPDGLVEVEIDSLFLSAIIQADARGTTLAVAPAPTPAPTPTATPERTPPAVSAASAPTHTPVSTPAASHPAPARPPGLRQAMPHPRPAQDADTRPDFERESLPAREPQAELVQVLPRAQLRERAAPVDVDLDAAADEPGSDRLPYQWLLGIAGAVVVLFAQIVNHYRDDLAASARFNHPLTALYASLGVTLNPRWDLHAYDVRQLGASVDPANSGNITVRASIKNAGPQPQPLPLLRVTLQDRFGNRIATRDVQPQSYVPGAVPASALLGAGQRIDAEMAFIDPGASAVGFELDACLPASGGGVACANDAGGR